MVDRTANIAKIDIGIKNKWTWKWTGEECEEINTYMYVHVCVSFKFRGGAGVSSHQHLHLTESLCSSNIFLIFFCYPLTSLTLLMIL